MNAPLKFNKQVSRNEERMKVIMQTVMCGPKGNAFQGTLLDLPEKEAKELIDIKAARVYDPQRDTKIRQTGLVRAER